MGSYFILLLILIFIILAKLFLKTSKKYNLFVFISFITANLYALIWLLWQYIYSYKEFKVAAVNASISIIADIVLDIFIFIFLLICINICFVLLNCHKLR